MMNHLIKHLIWKNGKPKITTELLQSPNLDKLKEPACPRKLFEKLELNWPEFQKISP